MSVRPNLKGTISNKGFHSFFVMFVPSSFVSNIHNSPKNENVKIYEVF